MQSPHSFPVLILCGRDQKRRELMETLDPDEKYPSKCVLPMLGKRVLDWELEILLSSQAVGEIFLIGLTPEEFPTENDLTFIPIPTTTTILEKILLGSEVIQKDYPDLEHLIICSGDTPCLAQESVDAFLSYLTEHPEADVLLSGVPEGITKKYRTIGTIGSDKASKKLNRIAFS